MHGCARGVERFDKLRSKNENSLNFTKTVKNLSLITLKTHCCTTLTFLPPLPLPPKKNVAKGEFILSLNLPKRALNVLRTVRISCSNDACSGARPVE